METFWQTISEYNSHTWHIQAVATLLAAAAAGVFTCVMVFVSNRYLPGALFSGVFNSILTFSVLQIWAGIYCGRRKHLDSMAEEEEDSHE